MFAILYLIFSVIKGRCNRGELSIFLCVKVVLNEQVHSFVTLCHRQVANVTGEVGASVTEAYFKASNLF